MSKPTTVRNPATNPNPNMITASPHAEKREARTERLAGHVTARKAHTEAIQAEAFLNFVEYAVDLPREGCTLTMVAMVLAPFFRAMQAKRMTNPQIKFLACWTELSTENLSALRFNYSAQPARVAR
jgi:hypothetical protein